jgi:hypothetical protein
MINAQTIRDLGQIRKAAGPRVLPIETGENGGPCQLIQALEEFLSAPGPLAGETAVRQR